MTAEPEIIAERRIDGIFDYYKYVYGVEYIKSHCEYTYSINVYSYR